MTFGDNSANFPGSVASVSDLGGYQTNRERKSLAQAMDSSQTTLKLNEDTSNLPSSGICTIEQERILYTSKNDSNNELTGLTRGYDGSTAASHIADAKVKFHHVAFHINQAIDEIVAIQSELGATGSQTFVRTDGSEPLTASWDVGNQDITNVNNLEADQVTVDNAGSGSDPTLAADNASQQLDITGDVDISGAITGDAKAGFANGLGLVRADIDALGTDTVVFDAETQTLTNKTIDAGTLTGTTTYTNAGAGADPTLSSNNASQVLDITGQLHVSSSLQAADLSLDSGTTVISSSELNLLDGMTSRTGADTNFVTGTAGSDNQIPTWNADGDLVGEANLTYDGTTIGLDDAVVINESGGDNDVRIEGSTNANLLETDAGLDAVFLGVPSSDPASGAMEASQVVFWLDETDDQIELRALESDGTTSITQTVGLVNAITDPENVVIEADNDSDNSGEIRFQTKGTTRWDIENDGDLVAQGSESIQPQDIFPTGTYGRNWTTLSAATTLAVGTHDAVNVDTSGGTVTVTLPDAPSNEPEFTIKRDGANTVTIDTAGTENIDGSTSLDLTNDNDFITVAYDSAATEWHQIA